MAAIAGGLRSSITTESPGGGGDADEGDDGYAYEEESEAAAPVPWWPKTGDPRLQQGTWQNRITTLELDLESRRDPTRGHRRNAASLDEADAAVRSLIGEIAELKAGVASDEALAAQLPSTHVVLPVEGKGRCLWLSLSILRDARRMTPMSAADLQERAACILEMAAASSSGDVGAALQPHLLSLAVKVRIKLEYEGLDELVLFAASYASNMRLTVIVEGGIASGGGTHVYNPQNFVSKFGLDELEEAARDGIIINRQLSPPRYFSPAIPRRALSPPAPTIPAGTSPAVPCRTLLVVTARVAPQ